jgi:hypothetical protein
MKVRALVRAMGPRGRGPSGQRLTLRAGAANGTPAIPNTGSRSSVRVTNCNGGAIGTVGGLLRYRSGGPTRPPVDASSSGAGTRAPVGRRRRDAPPAIGRAAGAVERAAPTDDSPAKRPRPARSGYAPGAPRPSPELAAPAGVRCLMEGIAVLTYWLLSLAGSEGAPPGVVHHSRPDPRHATLSTQRLRLLPDNPK